MKPPHNNRSGGPGRPPQDRGPARYGGNAPRGTAGPSGGGRSEQPQSGPGRPRFGQGQSDPARNRYGPRPQGAGTGQTPSRDRQYDQTQQGGRPFQPRPRPDDQSYRQRTDAPHHADRGPRLPEAPRGTLWLYGQHAVAAALTNPGRRLRRLLLTEEAEQQLAQRLPPPWSVAAERVERGRLDQLLGREIAHQGAALLADPLPPPSLAHVLERPGPIIVLDQVTDPRNVGAILRSAAAFGAAAVITQDRNSPEETGGLAKAASGALETMPLLRADNIARTLIALKAANIWTVGLDSGGPPLSGPALAQRRVALVLGAEGTGLRRLTRETCDEVAGLATRSTMDSLNVSAAAAVALYELARRA